MSATYLIARRLYQASPQVFTAMVYKIGTVSIALGLSATLVTCLIMQGVQRSVVQKLTGFGGHIYLTAPHFFSATYETPPVDRDQLPDLTQPGPYIRSVKACAYKAVLLKTTEDVEGILCKGLDTTATHDNLLPYITSGQLVNLNSPTYSQEIVLSTHTASKLQVKVGDTIQACILQHPPRYRKLRIVGLYTTHIPDIDEKLALCDLRLIQRLNDWPSHWVGGHEVFLQHWQQAHAVAKQLLDCLDSNWSIKTIDQEYAAIVDWLTIVRKNALIFMILILLVVSTNLASIVLIQTIERTAMTGILRALGASSKQLRQIMLFSNLRMIALGMCWGNGVGLGLCALQSHFRWVTLDATFYYIDYIPIVWNWYLILGLNVLVLSIVTAVLLVAIAMIVRYKPIKAIRFS